MNVECTHCSTVFRVDPRKVPAGGVRVRCSICRGVFEVAGAGESAASPLAASSSAASSPAAPQPVATAPVEAAAPTPQPAAAPDPTPAPAPSAPSAPSAGPAFQPASAPAPAADAPPAAVPAAPAAASPAATSAAPASAPPAASSPARSPFGSSDPAAKARRLARALVSDIVTYHPERRDRSLADGSLKREFMEEIKKSWEEYVGQVGAETARGTTHFRDALNDILAKGQSVF